MRTLAITFLFFLFTAVLPGQILKGDRILTPYNDFPISLASSPTAIAGNTGGLFLITEGEGALLTMLPQYGFAVGNRVVIGTGLNIAVNLFEAVEFGGGIIPFVRYYVVNKPNLMAYGGLRAGVAFNGEAPFLSSSSFFQPHVGLSLPLSDGILFAPEIGYNTVRRATVTVNFGFDFILGRNNREEPRVTGRYGQGSWMFGTQLGSTGFINRAIILRFSPEAHYFLSRRFALGVTAGTSQTRINFNGTQIRSSTSHVGLSSRFFPVQGRHFDLFTHAGFQLQFDERDNGRNTGDPFVDNLVIMDGGLGGLLFVRKRIALEMGLNLRIYPQDEVAELGLNTGVRFFLGGDAGAVK